MGLEYAVDQLYATGFSCPAAQGSPRDAIGRPYPQLTLVEQEFSAAGRGFSIRHVQLFDCYRAEWTDAAGAPMGAVVGATADEAAVYALAQLRCGQLQAANGQSIASA